LFQCHQLVAIAAIAAVAAPESEGSLSKILALPEMMESQSFFKTHVAPALLQSGMFLQTCNET
jgi:hypothetical protein